jgi:hypothetical protein
MSSAIAQVRVIYLALTRNNLIFKMQTITQAKMGLAKNTTDLLNIGSDLDPDSPEMKQLEQRRQRLHLIEQQMDSILGAYKTQLQAVETELESATKVLDKSIQMSFSYGGGR